MYNKYYGFFKLYYGFIISNLKKKYKVIIQNICILICWIAVLIFIFAKVVFVE